MQFYLRRGVWEYHTVRNEPLRTKKLYKLQVELEMKINWKCLRSGNESEMLGRRQRLRLWRR